MGDWSQPVPNRAASDTAEAPSQGRGRGRGDALIRPHWQSSAKAQPQIPRLLTPAEAATSSDGSCQSNRNGRTGANGLKKDEPDQELSPTPTKDLDSQELGSVARADTMPTPISAPVSRSPDSCREPEASPGSTAMMPITEVPEESYQSATS